MKIGFDVAQTCVERAGCGYYADSLARALAEHADVNELHLYHHFGAWLNNDVSQGTQINSPKVHAPFGDKTRADAGRLWHEISAGRASLPGTPDVVHSCSFQAPAIPGVPLVLTIYDVSFWANPEFATEGNRLVCQTGTLDALDRAAGIIFISRHARDEFERLLGGWLAETKRPSAVIPLAPRRLSEGDVTRFHLPPRFWLCVGSLEPRKNFAAALEAHARYWEQSTQPAPLLFAGSAGWMSDPLRLRIENAGPERVRHLGFVSDAELGTLYRRAEALLFPSWYEGFGLPVAEAMACGCAVICSDRASLPEAGGDAVLYIDPNSPSDLADAMGRLERADDFRRTLAGRGQARMKHFTWAQTAARTLEFYRTVLGRNTRASLTESSARTTV